MCHYNDQCNNVRGYNNTPGLRTNILTRSVGSFRSYIFVLHFSFLSLTLSLPYVQMATGSHLYFHHFFVLLFHHNSQHLLHVSWLHFNNVDDPVPLCCPLWLLLWFVRGIESHRPFSLTLLLLLLYSSPSLISQWKWNERPLAFYFHCCHLWFLSSKIRIAQSRRIVVFPHPVMSQGRKSEN